MKDLSESLGRLRELSQKVAHGDYDVFEDIAALTTTDGAPEVQELAEAFGMMVVRIEAREFHLSGVIDDLTEARRRLEDARQRLERENGTLRAEVSELRIHVDREKKDREVETIAESDYFKDLQKRARSMRARHSND
ncbi:HAMP domain-containing protein [Amorphus suaedae]